MLISSIIGIDHRSTMDLDTTLRNLPLTKDAIEKAFYDICRITTDDNITFRFENISPLREDDEYGGYRVTFANGINYSDALESIRTLLRNIK